MPVKRTLVIGAVWALALIAPAVGRAATFTVNTTADTSDAGGCTTAPACSLRDAVAAANASAEAEDVIVLQAGRYLLEAGSLSIAETGSLLIRGAGARSTVVDAQGKSRVFEINTQKATLEGFTVTGGVSEIAGLEPTLPGDGGGIVVIEGEELVLDRMAVTGNSANQNGGGISAPPEGSAASSKLSIVDSTISGNKVAGGAAEALGGGIYALGSLSMVNSTVAGNAAESTAGIVQGGGVLIGPGSEPSTISLLNSTIAGNSVGTGGVGGGLAIYNPSMLTEPGLSIKNTIIAGNTAAGAEADCGAVSLVTSVNDISGDASCMFTDPGSKQNTDPLLAPLANNGGETDTMALQDGSPALDAGTNQGCPAADQRGVARPQGSACDVGAYEKAVPPPTPPAASADLRLRAKPRPKHPRAGRKLLFLLTVSNRGPDEATGVVVKGTVPALAKKALGPKLGGRKACKLGKAKGGKRRLTCQLGSIASGKTKKLKVVVKPKHAGKMRVRARVRSGIVVRT